MAYKRARVVLRSITTKRNRNRDFTTVALPRHLVEAMRAIGRDEDRSLSAQMRVALTEYIRGREEPAAGATARDAAPKATGKSGAHKA
jgi:hypothetical protein